MKKHVTLPIDAELYEKLKDVAAAQYRSITGLVMWLIDVEVNRYKNSEKE